MSAKIDTLLNNIEVMNNTLATFDFSAFEPKEALSIKRGLEYVRDFCLTCWHFENGFNPDAENAE